MKLNVPKPINQAILCFIVPPPKERLHSSWRAIIYTREKPQKVHYKNRTLPSKIIPDLEIMKHELCDPNHLPAFVIQVTEQEAFIYIEDDVCEVIGTEIQLADGHNDPYLRGRADQIAKKPASPLIVPGSQPSVGVGPAPKLVMGIGTPTGPDPDLNKAYIVDLTFRAEPVSDQDTIDRVKKLAWNNSVSIV